MRLSTSVHFVGISGIGMSALARILLARGYHVSGSSDYATPLCDRLAEEGATIAIGHEAKNLGAAGTVVVSSAVPPANPELATARERGLEIVRRGELLAYLMEGSRGIAVAGTHGKTTATAMIARVLEAGDLDPTVVVGGVRIDTGSNAHDGKGSWFVAESDESDGSFLALRPEIAVVTNVENDHVTSDEEWSRMRASFETFLASVPSAGMAVVGIDEPNAGSIAWTPLAARTRTYGFAQASVRAHDALFSDFGSTSTIEVDGNLLGQMRLSVPGAINVLNALPAIAVGMDLGLPFSVCADALAGFRGVRRRFEVLARTPRLVVVDDYAHHPTAVAATIAAARADFSGPVVVAFQPHRYTRTRYLAAEFARALRAADSVILTDVYSASETPLAGGDARAIGEPLRALGGRVEYVGDVLALPEYVLAHAPEGALVLFLGAGSITNAAARLARELEARAVAT